MPTENQVREAKERAVQQFLAAPGTQKVKAFAATSLPRINVVGVGVGQKTINGDSSGELSVRFYVEHKLPPGAVIPDAMLPAKINGVPTDVVETGRFRRLPTAAVQAAGPIVNQGKVSPVQPGCSCGFRFPASVGTVMAGTLGALVADSNGRYILSNNHVLADEGHIPLGSPIFQPGLLDGGNPLTDLIARLSRFIPISPSAMNHVDCALARFEPSISFDPAFLPNVGKLASGAPVAPSVGMHVMKTGRTTGSTNGTITDIHATLTVDYDSGPCQFDEQIVITGDGGSFSGPGDSGSVIVDTSSKQATALLFAGSASHTIANRLEAVLTALGVALLA